MSLLTKNKKKSLEDSGFDLKFVESIQPEGGIKFGERFIETGDGFQAVLHVYEFAESVNGLWLSAFTNIPETVSTIDVSTADKSEVIKNINRSLNELKARSYDERHATDRNDALSEVGNLEAFAHDLSQRGEVVKLVHLRIYFYGSSQEELEKRIGDTKKDLEGKNHKTTLYQFRTRQEWMSMFSDYDTQMAMGGIRSGEVLPATSIGGGLPFHHQSLKDPRGTYLGMTSTQGAFMLDVFRSTKMRKSFNGFILGKMGYGKSTVLKQLEEGLFARDSFIRGFDKAGDFNKLIKSQEGLIIDLAGGNGNIINPLEIFATATDKTGTIVNEYGSFMQHLAKVTNMMRFMFPSLGDYAITEFRKYLREFYLYKNIIKPDYNTNTADVKVTGLDPSEYPTMSEFYDFLANYTASKPSPESRRTLDTLRLYVSEMVKQYGPLFDGHTTLSHLEDEPILFFDIDGISQLDKEVFQCQLFSALTILWSHAVKNGRKMKNLYENKKITLDEYKHFMVFIDECHNVINAQNLSAVKYVSDFQREMRKFGAGVFFATQTPAEVLPEGADNAALDEVKKVFELCQYKIFLNLDNSMLGRMREVLGDTVTDSEFLSLPKLQQGEALVQVSSSETYTVQFTPDQGQLDRFAGGQ